MKEEKIKEIAIYMFNKCLAKLVLLEINITHEMAKKYVLLEVETIMDAFYITYINGVNCVSSIAYNKQISIYQEIRKQLQKL